MKPKKVIYWETERRSVESSRIGAGLIGPNLNGWAKQTEALEVISCTIEDKEWPIQSFCLMQDCNLACERAKAHFVQGTVERHQPGRHWQP